MIRCTNCGTESPDSSQYCDECGTRLIKASGGADVLAFTPPSAYEPPKIQAATMVDPVNVTSIGHEVFPSLTPDLPNSSVGLSADPPLVADSINAKLLIERNDGGIIEFKLSGTEAVIGRWDADNGVFPDVDLDSYDPEAKVSRRHARIKRKNSAYLIEDLGSTNGTYVNRGRRLLPGTAQTINGGDEIIVGKTFLRFQTLD